MRQIDRHAVGRRGRFVAASVVAVVAAAVAILWSWNVLATDLFGASPIAFRHAIAAELLAGTLGAVAALVFRLVLFGGRSAAAA